jgi:YbbR domain-containing protein
VELLGNVGGEASLVIRDLMGRDILKETMNVQKSAANAYVDVTGFSPGTYFVTVTTDHGSFTTEFIKQ